MSLELTLCTDEVDAADRVDYWREAMRRALAAECRVEPHGRDFGASMHVLDCGPLDLVDVRGNAFRTERLGPGREGWVSIMFQLAGRCELSDGIRSAQLLPGDLCIVPPDRDIVADRLTPFHQLLANIRETDLDAALPDWRQRITLRIAGGSGRSAAMTGLLQYLAAHAVLLAAAERSQLGHTALHLLDGVCGAGQAASHGAVSETRLACWHRRRIEAHIREHLADSELDVPQIAAALGLSVRYVHKLFVQRGEGVMEWVRAQRLEACRHEIAERGGRSISEVAYSWGFTSAAHFSRAFRRRFGAPPSLL